MMSSGFVGKSMEKLFFCGGQINKLGGQNAISASCQTIFVIYIHYLSTIASSST